jgi:hypothetical protein
MSARRFAPARAITVTTDQDGAPRCLSWLGRTERIATVEASWSLEEGWWRGGPDATRRHYYRLVTRSGLLCVVYRDLARAEWYLEQIID